MAAPQRPQIMRVPESQVGGQVVLPAALDCGDGRRPGPSYDIAQSSLKSLALLETPSDDGDAYARFEFFALVEAAGIEPAS